MNIVEKVRQQAPLIHHLTNQVVMNFTANGLLAYGGSPIMAKEQAEVAEMASIANGVLINIGTLTEQEINAMVIAGKTANKRKIPVVLDPVGVAATQFRKKAVSLLLDNVAFSAIKGNAGEMAHLVGINWQTKGVESTDGSIERLEEIARLVANKYNTIAIITGKTDIITDGNEVRRNESGNVILTKITGAGCLLGSIITASLAVSNSTLDNCYDAIHYYGKAAERAIQNKNVKGTGTFIPYFIDELQR